MAMRPDRPPRAQDDRREGACVLGDRVELLNQP